MFMIKIRRAEPHEAGALTALAHASKRHWNDPESWIAAWKDDLTFTPTFIADQKIMAAVDGDRLVGCYALTGTPTINEIELAHFWIHPKSMGQGLGRRLFEHAVAEARFQNADALLIDSDPNAEAFYSYLGATRIGATRADMDGVRRELPRMRFDLQKSIQNS